MNFSAIPKDSLIGKLLRLPLRLLPANLVIPVIQGPMKGMRWVVGSGDHGYWLGSYELDFQRRFSRTVTPGDVVLDIGAHVGYYSLLAARCASPDGHVHAFEPLPGNAALIERHIHLNHLDNITLHRLAISDVSGTTRFGGGVSSSTGRIDLTGELEVMTASLDALLESGKVSAPAVIKIDVEGSEVEVLRGARRLLQVYRPAIFLATHGRKLKSACLEQLHSQGYQTQPLNAETSSAATEFIALHEALSSNA